LIAVLLLVALSITLAGIFPFRQLIAQQRQVDNTREKLGVLVEENAALEDQVAALQTEPEVERLAREQYGLVNPGETPYAVVQPELQNEPPPPVEVEPVDERTLLEQVWDWMTGRDLVPDE
jgi:cell division protein FtsB